LAKADTMTLEVEEKLVGADILKSEKENLV